MKTYLITFGIALAAAGLLIVLDRKSGFLPRPKLADRQKTGDLAEGA